MRYNMTVKITKRQRATEYDVSSRNFVVIWLYCYSKGEENLGG